MRMDYDYRDVHYFLLKIRIQKLLPVQLGPDGQLKVFLQDFIGAGVDLADHQYLHT